MDFRLIIGSSFVVLLICVNCVIGGTYTDGSESDDQVYGGTSHLDTNYGPDLNAYGDDNKGYEGDKTDTTYAESSQVIGYNTLPRGNTGQELVQASSNNKGKYSTLYAEYKAPKKEEIDDGPKFSAPALYRTGLYIFGILRIAEVLLFVVLIPAYIYHKFFVGGDPALGWNSGGSGSGTSGGYRRRKHAGGRIDTLTKRILPNLQNNVPIVFG